MCVYIHICIYIYTYNYTSARGLRGRRSGAATEAPAPPNPKANNLGLHKQGLGNRDFRVARTIFDRDARILA